MIQSAVQNLSLSHTHRKIYWNASFLKTLFLDELNARGINLFLDLIKMLLDFSHAWPNYPAQTHGSNAPWLHLYGLPLTDCVLIDFLKTPLLGPLSVSSATYVPSEVKTFTKRCKCLHATFLCDCKTDLVHSFREQAFLWLALSLWDIW